MPLLPPNTPPLAVQYCLPAILSWYEYVNRDMAIHGEFIPHRRQEQELVRKLENREDRVVCFTEAEIAIMYGWMDRAIFGKYRDDTSLFGYEQRMYTIIKPKVGVTV